MAEAPPPEVSDLLESVFGEFRDGLLLSILSDLQSHGRTGSLRTQPTVSRLSGGANQINLAIEIDRGDGGVWSAALRVSVNDTETSVTAAHHLIAGWIAEDSPITGWESSTTLKTETDGQRPELVESIRSLANALASDEAVKQAGSTFDQALPASDSNLRQQTASNSVEPQQMPPEAIEAIGVSASVQSVGRAVSDRDQVTAVDIAEALRTIHPEYAGGQFGLHALEAAAVDAHTMPWDRWIEEVRTLFDADAIARTEEVIDGRLLLAALGVLDPPLFEQLDESGVWAQLLIEIDEDAIVGIPVLIEAKAGVSLAHGYRNDDPDGDDLLGVEGEVNAICEVITDPDVKPPLAIGLFGEWGSGKSFFMEKMRQRIDHLNQDRSAATPPAAEIAQIRFNAWHYSDSNLWASLAVEMFERLADPEPVAAEAFDAWLKERGDDQRAARGELLGELESFREAKAELHAEATRLREKRGAVADKLEDKRAARERAIKNASLGDVIEALGRDKSVVAAQANITNALEISPAVTEWKEVASELRTTSGYAANVWRLVRHKPLLLLAVAAGIAAIAVLPPLLTSLEEWASRLVTATAAIGTIGGAVLGLVRPAASQVKGALEVIEQSIQQADAVEGRLRAEYDEGERVLDAELRASDLELAEIGAQISRIDTQIEEVERRQHDLSIGRQLYDFLSQRAVDYRTQQGVIGMLHRDFRLLDAKLRALADSVLEPAPVGSHALRPIHRVVLYIDDLDRCPPEKVLQVLQAVHLLLALELFIVVVGVDPRWLNRSLRHEYRHLADAGTRADDGYITLLPIQYLEKIFQIPLTLPRMEEQGYQRLIQGLAPGVDASRGPAAELANGQARSTAAATSAAGSVDRPTGDAPRSEGEAREAPRRALLTPQVGLSAASSGGRRIDLTPDELGFAQRLGGLVETPRAAKRLLNIYRLVRATQAIGRGSHFLGADRSPGEFFAVQTLLAVAAGFPAETDDLLIALQRAGEPDSTEDEAARSWSDFVGRLVPSAGGTDGAITTAATGVIRGDLARWRELQAGLNETLRFNPLNDLAPYVEWGPRVARFSFTL